MGDVQEDKNLARTPGGPDIQSGTPGGKVGPRGTVEAPNGGDQPAGEAQTFKGEDIPDPDDLTGPAGDPAEGKPVGESTWPA